MGEIMRFAVLAMLWAVGSCSMPENEAVKACEDFILTKLRSPSTYKRIEASGSLVPFDKPETFTAVVEYDAANAYGTPIRDRQVCVFGLKDGKPDTSRYYDFDSDFSGKGKDVDQAVRESNAAADAAMRAADNAERAAIEAMNNAEDLLD
ncbi:hypothetical protein [Sphingobium herbicidovorans]|nr:hypothetical protein [Sphingobium herbicidovorans]